MSSKMSSFGHYSTSDSSVIEVSLFEFIPHITKSEVKKEILLKLVVKPVTASLIMQTEKHLYPRKTQFL